MSTSPLPFERFVEFLAQELMVETDDVAPDSLLVEELGLQSIDVIHLVDRVERELGRSLEGVDLLGVETVEELYWQLVAGGDDGGDSVVAALASAAGAEEALPHEAALRAWLPDDPNADVQTLVGMLNRRAAVTPDRVGLSFEGTEVSFRELARSAAQLAGALAVHGVEAGDRVVLVMPNSVEFFAAFYGVQHLRATAVPLFHVPQPERIARIASHCGARVVITLRPLARPLRRRLEAQPGGEGLVLLDMPSLATEPPRAGFQLPQPSPDDLAMLQYTSGTTGDAKGVMLTHRALLANLRQAIPKARFTEQDVFVSWLPVYHDMGLITMTMCPLYLGAKLVLLPVSPNADAWLGAIQEHRGTVTAAPDFAYRYALRTGGTLDRYDVDSMRMALVAAEPVRARTIARFESALGIPGVLRPGYGLAESSVAVTFFDVGAGPVKVDAKGFVSVGTAVAGTELSIRDADDRPLPAGVPGQICLRSPSQTLGYFHNAEATAGLFTPDGFVRTGDVGYIDTDGDLYIVDRLKNLIIVGGRNLSPRELEEAADAIPGVGLTMAVGFDEGGDAGEQLQLIVETEAAPTPEQQRELGRAVRAAVQERMGIRAERVYVVPPNTIPRTYNGKLQYAVMRQRLRDSGSPLA